MDFFNRQDAYQSEKQDSGIKLTIFGIGGGGCNAINRLMQKKEFSGVDFIAANTDKMALDNISLEGVKKVYLGEETTRGMGAGSDPEVGKKAAIESKEEIEQLIRGTSLLFVTAGMGGGTGTGGAPIVAACARDLGILTIGVVTKPFHWEGSKKMRVAEAGIAELRRYVDVLVVVPNEKAYTCQNNASVMFDVFQVADNVLKNSILGVVNIVGHHSLINTDFADIRTVIQGKGLVHIGIGKASGENRVMEALRQACKDPLMETSVAGAQNVIVNVNADRDVPSEKIIDAFNMIPEIVAEDANIITGFGFSEQKDFVSVTIIATGFGDEEMEEEDNALRTKARAEDELMGEFRVKKTVTPIAPAQEETIENDIPEYLRFLKDKKY